MGTAKVLPPRLQAWVDARKRHRLSRAHIQMARELGLNPAKLGKLNNHKQEPWKAPLPQFIEHLYAKRFGRERPDVVKSIEETAGPAGVATPNRSAQPSSRQSTVEDLVSEHQYYEFLTVDRVLDARRAGSVADMGEDRHTSAPPGSSSKLPAGRSRDPTAAPADSPLGSGSTRPPASALLLAENSSVSMDRHGLALLAELTNQL